MKVLGIESSCDECAAAVVEDGRRILSNVVASQIPYHAAYNGVVPEIASRMHTEWITGVVKEALTRAGLEPAGLDGVAATAHPGLLGSLLVGLNFAKAFAWARNIPFIAVDHMLAHLYAPRLLPGPATTQDTNRDPIPPDYPFLGLLVSGGHSIICRVDNFDDITVLGTTIDDAVGEAFDKVSKYYRFGYPGGAAIDRLAKTGDPTAFNFPMPKLYKGDHPYDVSYSGLKTAVINQLEQFRRGGPSPLRAHPAASQQRLRRTQRSGRIAPYPRSGGIPPATPPKTADTEPPNTSPLLSSRIPEGQLLTPHPSLSSVNNEAAGIAASFQKTAVEILLRALFRAAEDTGLSTIVAGGGVAANSLLRERLAGRQDLRCVFPPLELCGDNGAMVAGLGWQYLARGDRSPLNTTASARIKAFKRRYP